MRALPDVRSLQEAVQAVIRENKKDRYNPTYFTRIVVNAPNLVQACTILIKSPSSYSALTDAFVSHPDLLILEDFVSVYGSSWSFSDEVIEEAQKRVAAFDEFVKHKRYSVQ